MDYDSFALASPSVTRALLWMFAKETPFGSQTRPQAQTVTVQAQPILRQSLQVLRLRCRPQPQGPSQARPPRPAQAYFPQPQAAVPLGARRVPSDSS